MFQPLFFFFVQKAFFCLTNRGGHVFHYRVSFTSMISSSIGQSIVGLSDFTSDHHHHHQHTMLRTKKKNTKIGCIQLCKALKKGRKLDESLMKEPCQGC
jgi:hypothetical protein